MEIKYRCNFFFSSHNGYEMFPDNTIYLLCNHTAGHVLQVTNFLYQCESFRKNDISVECDVEIFYFPC